MNDPLPDEPNREEPNADVPQPEEPQDEDEDEAVDEVDIDDHELETTVDDLEPDEDVDEFADQLAARTAADGAAALVADEPAVPAVGFFDAGADMHALDDLTLVGRPSVLDRLGPAHFRSKGFSFMGFLQTVYDHVAGEVGGKTVGRSEEGAS